MRKRVVLAVVLYFAIGYFVGVPISVIGDGMLKTDKPMPMSSAIIAWPILTLIVVLDFPVWLHEKYKNQRYGKNS